MDQPVRDAIDALEDAQRALVRSFGDFENSLTRADDPLRGKLVTAHEEAFGPVKKVVLGEIAALETILSGNRVRDEISLQPKRGLIGNLKAMLGVTEWVASEGSDENSVKAVDAMKLRSRGRHSGKTVFSTSGNGLGALEVNGKFVFVYPPPPPLSRLRGVLNRAEAFAVSKSGKFVTGLAAADLTKIATESGSRYAGAGAVALAAPLAIQFVVSKTTGKVAAGVTKGTNSLPEYMNDEALPGERRGVAYDKPDRVTVVKMTRPISDSDESTQERREKEIMEVLQGSLVALDVAAKAALRAGANEQDVQTALRTAQNERKGLYTDTLVGIRKKDKNMALPQEFMKFQYKEWCEQSSTNVFVVLIP